MKVLIRLTASILVCVVPTMAGSWADPQGVSSKPGATVSGVTIDSGEKWGDFHALAGFRLENGFMPHGVSAKGTYVVPGGREVCVFPLGDSG